MLLKLQDLRAPRAYRLNDVLLRKLTLPSFAVTVATTAGIGVSHVGHRVQLGT